MSRIIGAAVVLLIVDSLLIFPHYLSYFNQTIGGPKNGYKHLVDSSLDWGQDLPALKKWLHKNHTGDVPVYLSYFGSAEPEYYGLDVIPLKGFLGFDPPPNRPHRTHGRNLLHECHHVATDPYSFSTAVDRIP